MCKIMETYKIDKRLFYGCFQLHQNKIQKEFVQKRKQCTNNS